MIDVDEVLPWSQICEGKSHKRTELPCAAVVVEQEEGCQDNPLCADDLPALTQVVS